MDFCARYSCEYNLQCPSCLSLFFPLYLFLFLFIFVSRSLLPHTFRRSTRPRDLPRYTPARARECNDYLQSIVGRCHRVFNRPPYRQRAQSRPSQRRVVRETRRIAAILKPKMIRTNLLKIGESPEKCCYLHLESTRKN